MILQDIYSAGHVDENYDRNKFIEQAKTYKGNKMKYSGQKVLQYWTLSVVSFEKKIIIDEVEQKQTDRKIKIKQWTQRRHNTEPNDIQPNDTNKMILITTLNTT